MHTGTMDVCACEHQHVCVRERVC